LSAPLVAVVVPVFDGAAFLPGCIESVLAQKYPNWVLIIADNASTDGSSKIAVDAAARDPRVRVRRHDDHLGMLDNWNRGLADVPAEAVYVKQLNVDDRLRPDCLARLVEVAEAHPEVGVVSAYVMLGAVRLPRLDRTTLRIVRGGDAVREVLRSGPSHLVHPSGMLLRRAAVARWPRFYDARVFPPGFPVALPLAQADKEAFFDVLERFDLAFVPEVLADLRATEPRSATGFSARVGAWQVGRIETILRHGDRFLDASARRAALRAAAWRCLRSLAWRATRNLIARDPDFVLHHRLALAHLLPRLRAESLGAAGLGLRMAGRLFGVRPEAGEARGGAA